MVSYTDVTVMCHMTCDSIYIHVYVVVFRCAPLEDIPVLHLQLLDSLEETLVSHIIYIYRITDRELLCDILKMFVKCFYFVK